MPMSTWNNTEKAAEFIRKTKPETVLDIGVGFGKWGFLIRGSSETICQRIKPEDWVVNIEGIEAEPRYVTAWKQMLEFLYNKIHVMDVRNWDFQGKMYDLVIAGDVLEHLERDESIKLIEDILDNTRSFIFAIPIGEPWLHTNDAYAENYPYEKHRCVWLHSDLLATVPELPKGVRIAEGGTLWIPRPNRDLVEWLDARFARISNELKWFPDPLDGIENVYEGIQDRMAKFEVQTHTSVTKNRTINIYLGERHE